MTWRMALQEQVTQSGQGLSRMVVALPPYTWVRCDWDIIHPPASLTDELRLWPPHQPHMKPDPWSSLPTRDYLSPIVTRLYIYGSVSSCLFFLFQISNYSTLLLSYVKTYSSCNSTDEDPQIEMFGPLNWSSFLCYVRGHAKITNTQ